MGYVLASDGLAPWGQAAAIVLALYLLVSILLGLALTALLLFGFAWIREKSELLKKLRPQVIQLNQAAIATRQGHPVPDEIAENKIVSAIIQVPKVAATLPARASSIERKVDQGSERVAGVVIELHARAVMVRSMARAFFLPGLTPSRPVTPLELQESVSEPEAAVVVQSPREEPPMEQEIIIVQSSR